MNFINSLKFQAFASMEILITMVTHGVVLKCSETVFNFQNAENNCERIVLKFFSSKAFLLLLS